MANGIRFRLLSDLVRDLLGPCGGPRELLGSDPCDLYLTGVLAPRVDPEQPLERDPDAEAAGLADESDEISAEDDTDDPAEPVAVGLSPALNPQVRPSGFGVTFEVETSSGVELELCVTWGRYLPEDGTPGGWRRHPRAWLSERLSVGPSDRREFCLGPNGALSSDSHGDAEISVLVRTRPVPGSGGQRVSVTVSAVNIMPRRPRARRAEDHIFQPQIRVLVRPEPVPMRVGWGRLPDRESEVLELLQEHRAVRARGHMCAAVWRETDPERDPDTAGVSEEEVERLRALTWPDGQILPAEEARRFTAPHVRTEFMPLYAVETPDAGWPVDAGPVPQLRADHLAECWEPNALRRALAPIVDEYRRWIDEWGSRARQIAGTPGPRGDAAMWLLNRARGALGRMEAGLELLLRDPDARLAFCFACRAMALQHQWARGQPGPPFEWRPFQMAFILHVLESLVRRDSYDRDVVDLLWVPTGLGKTEAYLGLVAFTIAYRRRRALRSRRGYGSGTAVISRYTLRLLTIQQFRRALRLVTACEYLRVHGLNGDGPVGWRPARCHLRDDFIWGTARFAIGLWVGGNVTPNRLQSIDRRPRVPGAVELLQQPSRAVWEYGEPAQVLECPACGARLAFDGLPAGTHTLFWMVRTNDPAGAERAIRQAASPGNFTVQDCRFWPKGAAGTFALEVRLDCRTDVDSQTLTEWLGAVLRGHACHLGAHPARPGYVVRTARGVRTGSPLPVDIEILCPNPQCPLNTDVLWSEGVPLDDWPLETGRVPADRFQQRPGSYQSYTLRVAGRDISSPDGMCFRAALPHLRPGTSGPELFLSTSVPIPAVTVDELVYHRCPSVVVATVDKFARLSWEPKAGALFGNVNRYHPRSGYYREGVEEPPPPRRIARSLAALDPPELILQDELHLIEGPLGSLFGLYELAVDRLCCPGGESAIPKYIASTATIRRAEEQVQALFFRRVHVFPPHGIRWEDRFFLREREPHPLEADRPGRLYAGICAPGRGALTPLYRILARLLQSVHDLRESLGDAAADPWWTLVAFFNAVRELAGGRALCRQDVREWIRRLAAGGPARELSEDTMVELSSRIRSTDLPGILSRLERMLPDRDVPDVLLTTSMFGTGVDVTRLNLMLVAGQPKTTSAYIQATGRVGRATGALVVTFLRATRPRDLSHYEFFTAYHRRLYTFVEPVTVMPFSPQAVERAAGPVCVALLRCGRDSSHPWHLDVTARDMQSRRQDEAWLPDLFEERARRQPDERRPEPGEVRELVGAQLDRWHQAARRWMNLHYLEYCFGQRPEHPVVLGDVEHRGMAVYEMALQSLRDVEDMTRVSVSRRER